MCGEAATAIFLRQNHRPELAGYECNQSRKSHLESTNVAKIKSVQRRSHHHNTVRRLDEAGVGHHPSVAQLPNCRFYKASITVLMFCLLGRV